jgi:hypothetical protein
MNNEKTKTLDSEKTSKSESHDASNAKAKNKELRRKRIWKYCKEIAENKSILDLFTEELHEDGVAGEDATLKTLYLCTTSRLLDSPVSVVMKVQSSAGKSSLVDRVLERMPKKAYTVFSSSSKKGLIRSDESYEHKMIVIHHRFSRRFCR